MHCRKEKNLLILFGMLFISGCMVYPKEVRYYDEECGIERRHFELHAEGINGSCSGTDPATCAAALITVGAASAIISGSIAVIGNFVYWLEELGNCKPDNEIHVSLTNNAISSKSFLN